MQDNVIYVETPSVTNLHMYCIAFLITIIRKYYNKIDLTQSFCINYFS